MDGLTRIAITLSLVAVLCLLTCVQGTLVNDEYLTIPKSTEDRHLKRSLCNTFGGCSGFETGLRFTGRSFSDKPAKTTGHSATYARPPYSFNSYQPSHQAQQQYGQQYAASRNQQSQADYDLSSEQLPAGWTTTGNRGYQFNKHQQAFDNNIR